MIAPNVVHAMDLAHLNQMQKPMTVQDLRDRLNEIEDGSTPVFLEDGKPVHYTCHGMSGIGGEDAFFIGLL